MELTCSELIYTSSQQGLLTGADGFGVRTFTAGLPEWVVDEIKGRNLFGYSAGSRPLASTHQLIANPDLVDEYPDTYAYFCLQRGAHAHYVLLRTIFIGRDYGWYLSPPETGARSGNTFTHALVFPAPLTRRNLPGVRRAAFLPATRTNAFDNPELRQWLTGPADLLPLRTLPAEPGPGIRVGQAEPEQIIPFMGLVYAALAGRKPLLVRAPARDAATYLDLLGGLVPDFLLKKISFLTNYQDFSTDTGYAITFTNEFFIDFDPAAYYNAYVFDTIGHHTSSPPASRFVDYLTRQIAQRDFAGVESVLDALDHMIEQAPEALDLDLLYACYAYLYLPDESGEEFIAAMQAVTRFQLKETFRDELPQFIQRAFQEAFKHANYPKILQTLQLAVQLRDEDLAGQLAVLLTQTFSSEFFKGACAAGLTAALHRAGLSLDLLYPFIHAEAVVEHYEAFAREQPLRPADCESFCLFFLRQLPPAYHSHLLRLALQSERVTDRFVPSFVAGRPPEAWAQLLHKENFFFDLDPRVHDPYLAVPVQTHFAQLAARQQTIPDLFFTNPAARVLPFWRCYAKEITGNPPDYRLLLDHFRQCNALVGTNYFSPAEAAAEWAVLPRALVLHYRPVHRERLDNALAEGIGYVEKSQTGAAPVLPGYLPMLRSLQAVLRPGASETDGRFAFPDLHPFRLTQSDLIDFILSNTDLDRLAADGSPAANVDRLLRRCFFSFADRAAVARSMREEIPTVLFSSVCHRTEFFRGDPGRFVAFAEAYLTCLWAAPPGGPYPPEVLESHTRYVIAFARQREEKWARSLIAALRGAGKHGALADYAHKTCRSLTDKISDWVDRITLPVSKATPVNTHGKHSSSR